MYHTEALSFSIKDIPNVFTKFRNKTEHDAIIRTVFDTPKQIKSPEIPHLNLPKFEALDLKFVPMDKRVAIQLKGGETKAKKRLNHYFFETQSISKYKKTRKQMVGPNYSTKFSASLAMGCISPRYIYAELKKYENQFGANQSTYWLIFELL